MMRLLHRLIHPGCDETCCSCEDHRLAMSALGRMRGGAGAPNPIPPAGAPSGSTGHRDGHAPGSSMPGRSSPAWLRAAGGRSTHHDAA